MPINNPPEAAALTVAEIQVFTGNTPNPAAWTALDLSAVVGANAALVILKAASTGSPHSVAFRKNGDTDEHWSGSACTMGRGAALAQLNVAALHLVYVVATDNAGIIEWYAQTAAIAITIDIIAYIK